MCEGEEIRGKQVAIGCFSWPAAKGEERESFCEVRMKRESVGK